MAFDDDARVEELKFLTSVAKGTTGMVALHSAEAEFKAMVVHMYMEGYFNGVEHVPFTVEEKSQIQMPSMNAPFFAQGRKIEWSYWRELMQLINGQNQSLQISHKGRVRMAELRQILAAERQRESFGILLDGRYRLRDLELHLARATPLSPVSLAFFDMNGLKAINDTYGHAPGDEAIRTFMRTISAGIDGRGEGYRVGGDEVLVILPKTSIEEARKTMIQVLQKLAAERIQAGGVSLSLSSSCGVVSIPNLNEGAAEAIKRADTAMYRAKNEAKKVVPRPNVIAVDEATPEIV